MANGDSDPRGITWKTVSMALAVLLLGIVGYWSAWVTGSLKEFVTKPWFDRTEQRLDLLDKEMAEVRAHMARFAEHECEGSSGEE